ncbi:MAG: hypothetical protein ABIM88_02485 [candidate division WOR-3 bacterium]
MDLLCDSCRNELSGLFGKHLKSTEGIEILGGFPYEGPVRNLVVDFKYHGIRGIAKEMALFMAERINGLGINSLVPVPIHRGKIRERGYSQTALLAREISRITGIPVCDCVKRRRYTVAQVELRGEERLRNLAGAFVFKGPVPEEPVAIVDDVATTGTTISEVSRVIPATRKIGLVFAIAGEGQDAR